MQLLDSAIGVSVLILHLMSKQMTPEKIIPVTTTTR